MPHHGTLHVMSFGLGGNHGDGISHSGNSYTHSGYLSSPENFLAEIPSYYEPESVDGCWIIDKHEVLEDKPGLAFRSPMCNPKLTGIQIDRFSDLNAADSLVLQAFAQGDATQRSMAALAAMSIIPCQEPAPLDYVSPAGYAAWWRIRGARVGILCCHPTPHIEWAE